MKPSIGGSFHGDRAAAGPPVRQDLAESLGWRDGRPQVGEVELLLGVVLTPEGLHLAPRRRGRVVRGGPPGPGARGALSLPLALILLILVLFLLVGRLTAEQKPRRLTGG